MSIFVAATLACHGEQFFAAAAANMLRLPTDAAAAQRRQIF